MLPGTPYARRKGYVRIHVFTPMLQVNLYPYIHVNSLYFVHILRIVLT